MLATGLGMLAYPSIVVRLLLESEIAGAGILVSSIASTALIGLGIACYPGGVSRGLLGMTVNSAISAVYMAGVGLSGIQIGLLWWPGCVVHGASSR